MPGFKQGLRIRALGLPRKKAGIVLGLTLFFFFSILQSGDCTDLGGSLDNSTGFTYSDAAALTQSDKLSLWFDTEIGDFLNLSVQGSSLFDITIPYNVGDPYIYFDLDFLKLEGTFPNAFMESSIFEFKLGRFNFADFTKRVLSHKIDGISLSLGFPWAIFSTSFGFSGLLFKHSSQIILSRGDANDKTDDSKWLAPNRLIGTVGITFPELLLRQTLNLAFLYQFDLRISSELTSPGTITASSDGGRLTSQYTGIGLSGPIVPSLYYDCFYYLGTGSSLSYIDSEYVYAAILASLLGGSIRLYLDEVLYSRISLKFLMATGDPDYELYFREGNTFELAHTFVPISSSSLALVFSPVLGNIFLFDLSYSIKPFSMTGSLVMENFQIVLNGITFFRMCTGKISEEEIDSDSTDIYLGTEIDAVVNFRPLSDFGMALSYGIFIPNNITGGAFLSSRDLEMLGRLEFSVAF